MYEAVQCSVVTQWRTCQQTVLEYGRCCGSGVERWFHDSSLSSRFALASMSLNWCQQYTAEDMLNY